MMTVSPRQSSKGRKASRYFMFTRISLASTRWYVARSQEKSCSLSLVPFLARYRTARFRFGV